LKREVVLLGRCRRDVEEGMSQQVPNTLSRTSRHTPAHEGVKRPIASGSTRSRV
jgi:hypothetical protein